MQRERTENDTDLSRKPTWKSIVKLKSRRTIRQKVERTNKKGFCSLATIALLKQTGEHKRTSADGNGSAPIDTAVGTERGKSSTH